MATVTSFDELDGHEAVRRFEGRDHGSSVSGFLVLAAPPGSGPVLHRHPYDETFFVLEGRATFTVDGETVEASAGRMLVAPANAPHRFVNSGDGPLRMVTVHASDHIEQEDLDEAG
ncbi:MAG TPA: cupin domain-containing protein [Thermoleophilaceae bacterium]|jgi:mannose-6-phosphate isomerase-like protein (cupin superfamily)